MKICLATVHASPAFTPLALLYLKAYLVEQGPLSASDVGILEFAAGDSAEEITRRVLQGAPDVVGLSCYVWNVETLLIASRRIKQLRPEIRIVLGGPEVGPVARLVLEKNPAVDCVVKSEGELVFAEIVAAWMNGRDISEVKGICYRQGGAVFDNGDAPILDDLNKLAAPLSMFDSDPKGRIICIETQRGCVFRCNFCFYNKDLSIRNRRFDLGRVEDELRYWLQQDISRIYLMDPVFNLNAARAKEICRFIAAHNLRRIPFHTEVWAEFIDEELAQLMHEANFRYLEVGLQTTDAGVLAAAERRLKLARFVEGIEYLKRFNVPFEVQLIYGLPGETRASFRKSLDFAASLQPPHLAVFMLMVLPGTELGRRALQLDIEHDPAPPYHIRSHRSMSADDIAYGLQVSEAVGKIGEAWTVRLLGRESGVSFSDVIDEWIAWAGGEAADAPVHADAPDSAKLNESIGRFIRHFCRRRQIPPKFYEASSAIEFRDKQKSSAHDRVAPDAGFARVRRFS